MTWNGDNSRTELKRLVVKDYGLMNVARVGIWLISS
jgi:hypothetical protein